MAALPGIGRRASAEGERHGEHSGDHRRGGADAERIDDGAAIERTAQHLAVVGEGERRAFGVEQARAEHLEQRIKKKDTEEQEPQCRDGDRQALLVRDRKRHGRITSRAGIVGERHHRAHRQRMVRRIEGRHPEQRAVGERDIETRQRSQHLDTCRRAGKPRPAGRRLLSEAQGLGAQRHPDRRGKAERLGREQVGRAHELGGKARGGLAVDVGRPADLLELAGVHQSDAVGDRHRLLLVVRDIERGDAERLLQLADLAAHADAQARIEVGKRLVEQQDLRADHQRAGDCHALQLAAGELMRPALAIACELHEPQRLLDPLAKLRRRHFARFQAIGDVARHGEVGKHGIVLEDHADIAQMRRQPVDASLAEADLAGIELTEARDHAQERGLAAARGPEQREELTLAHFEVDVVDRPHRAEGAGGAADRDARHLLLPHPEEARSAVSKDGPHAPCSLPTLRDAALRAAPQGEVVVPRNHRHRDSWIKSLMRSRVLVRFSVQPSSSYLTSLTADIAGMPPGSLVRSTSLRVGRR